ncbi:MAG: hypothetical protein KBA26_10305 [Candidatus Delongbacteria bacterium]|nr:hypothetical protein [Candidatus Delongbacteria bacterium]
MRVRTWMLLMVLIMSLGLMVCSSDEDEDPTITGFTANGQSAYEGNHAGGSTVNFEFIAGKGSKELKSYKVQQQISGNVTTLVQNDITGDPSTKAITYSYTVPTSATAGSTITLVFTVKDEDANEVSKTYTITVSTATADFYSYSITLGAHENVTGSFYCALGETGTVYTLSTAKTNASSVDLVYYYGATNKSAMAAPSDASLDAFTSLNVTTWATRNATKLHKVSGKFDSAATSTAIQNAYVESSASGLVINLAVNEEVAFKTVSGRYGVLKIASIDTGTAGKIVFSVKVSK